MYVHRITPSGMHIFLEYNYGLMEILVENIQYLQSFGINEVFFFPKSDGSQIRILYLLF